MISILNFDETKLHPLQGLTKLNCVAHGLEIRKYCRLESERRCEKEILVQNSLLETRIIVLCKTFYAVLLIYTKLLFDLELFLNI